MSDTPRTDANADIEEHGPFAPAREMVHADFARQLEREFNAAKAALSGRTVSCSNCNALAAENAKMREAINGVSKIIRSIELNDIFEETMRNHAVLALSKLQPYLK